LSGSGESKKSDEKGEKCGMHVSEGSLEQTVDWKKGRKESMLKASVNVGG